MAAGSDARFRRSSSRGRAQIVSLVGLLILAGAVGLGWWYRNRSGPAPAAPGRADISFPVAALPPSRFQNTSPDAQYVGSEQCRSCHEQEFQAYRETGMGRSLDLLDPEQEPPDVVFTHAKSGRQYRVYRQDGQMRHQESLLGRVGEPPVVLADHAIPYVIGSGRHSRSYLLEIDGFMVESPLTWYTSRKAWGMSPGYDIPVHEGFARAVDEGCLNCHSGDSRSVGGSFQRVKILETWIGCERCHGPGSRHVDHWSGQAALAHPVARPDSSVDLTIVNPRHLDRKLSESICAQCHLRATAGVMVRGRSLVDFRPGLPLELFRADFRLSKEPSQMTVVGHVEQLQASRCYQRSEMTCTTCHNPHGFPKKSERVAYYRRQCLNCHGEGDCKVDSEVRRHKSSDNNCLTCHMPTSDTEIPHLAFTHHRIGIHPPRTAEPSAARATGELIPLCDLSPHSDLDRQRLLGLAYMQAAADEHEEEQARRHDARAYEYLLRVWNAGMRDAEVAAALALLAGRGGHEAGEFVQFALEQRNVSGMIRINALLAAAAWYAQRGDFAQGVSAVREVVQLRRAANDWKLLSFLENRSGNHAAAQSAMEKASEIEGPRPAVSPR